MQFSDLQEVEDILLKEPIVVKSIKELNLRLMRKGPAIFSKYHCFDLVRISFHDLYVPEAVA